MTPTARSMNYLRKLGYMVHRVEQVIPMPGRPFPKRRDCFGFGDLLAVGFGSILLIQVTSTGNLNAHEKKILEDPVILKNATNWIKSNGLIQLHGWAKRGPRGQRKKWQVTMRDIVHNGSGLERAPI